MKIRFRFSIVFAFILTVFLFQDALSVWIPLLSYLDEVSSLLLLIYIHIYFGTKRTFVDKRVYRLIKIWAVFIAAGIIGNFISGYQSFMYILLDILTYSKLLISIIAFSTCFSIKRDKYYEETAWIVASAVSILLILLILHENIFEPVFPYLSDRYGVKSLKLFFSNQTYLALMGVVLLIIHYCFGEKKKLNIVFMVMDCIVSVSTFRTKAIGFVVIGIVVICILSRFRVKSIFFIGSILGIIGGLVGWQYLDYYFFSGSNTSLRLLLFRGGVLAANKFFPFGAGFGTYCSAASKMHYSAMYSVLGMQSIYLWDGLHDMFWASVLGQFGLIGTAVYSFFIIEIVLMVSTFKAKSTRLFWGGLLACAYVLIASLGESSFSSFYVVIFGAFIGYLHNKSRKIL